MIGQRAREPPGRRFRVPLCVPAASSGYASKLPRFVWYTWETLNLKPRGKERGKEAKGGWGAVGAQVGKKWGGGGQGWKGGQRSTAEGVGVGEEVSRGLLRKVETQDPMGGGLKGVGRKPKL